MIHPGLIRSLMALRYTLIWARVRGRSGRLALLAGGMIALAALLVFVLLGGLGAAQFAVAAHQSRWIARRVLSGLFVGATGIAVLGGWGIRELFSDAALRRYPLNAADRFAVRHLAAIFDPVWLVVLGFELALATGIYVFGNAGIWRGVIGVLLLVIINYLAARSLACLGASLMRFRGSQLVFISAVAAMTLSALLIGPALAHNSNATGALRRLLQYSPPIAAADVIAGSTPSETPPGAAVLLLWLSGLVCVLPWLERWSLKPAKVWASAMRWPGIYERLASLFPRSIALLVAKSLRFYFRFKKVAFMSVVPLVIIGTQLAATPIQRDPRERFLLALSLFALVGVCAPLPVATNQFGYEASAFRRYLLLPVSASRVLRANSYVSLLCGSIQSFFFVALWIALAPVAFDARMPVMLLASALTSMLLFNAAALWTSLLAPRAASYNLLVDFNVSAGGAVLFHAILWPAAIGGQLLRAYAEPEAVLRYWWVSLPAIVLGSAIYMCSLWWAGAQLPQLSERLMNRLEGRG